jgi:hypothetical protein
LTGAREERDRKYAVYAADGTLARRSFRLSPAPESKSAPTGGIAGLVLPLGSPKEKEEGLTALGSTGRKSLEAIPRSSLYVIV